MKPIDRPDLVARAEELWALPVAHRVNTLGGYGARGDVIYEAPPPNCPSVLVDSRGDATLTVMSNGSVEFVVKNQRGLEISVLAGSFDQVEKRETGVPASNVWLEMNRGPRERFCSLVNPASRSGLVPVRSRIVKLGDPERAMWFMSEFRPAPGVRLVASIRYALAFLPPGPVLKRDIVVCNEGSRKADASVWTWFDLHGTQKFSYDKPIWFDSGLPLTPTETIAAENTPWCDHIQIKRVSTALTNARSAGATCDYTGFVGNSSASALLPDAVRRGTFLPGGAGNRMNRFITPTVAANRFTVSLRPGQAATIRQALLYVTDERIITRFRQDTNVDVPSYGAMAKRFRIAASRLVRTTAGALEIARLGRTSAGHSGFPAFELTLPRQPIMAHYANSSWTGVEQIYEQCRSHGAMLADGIEVGTRDRGQDMWPKMKADPGRVRADLVHAFSFMFRTCPKPPAPGRRPLTITEKLHGMFPRQYPSAWRDRSTEVANDNRPYADSPLWLINSLDMYLKETGDLSILDERVKSVRLTRPDKPEESKITGCEETFTVFGVVFEILACFGRHMADSPYGLPQILGGDWCDPVDMFGTSKVGDFGTLGHGRGTQIRLAGHLFDTLVQVVDLCEVPAIRRRAEQLGCAGEVKRLKREANALRANALRFAWEDGTSAFAAGFIDSIHEFDLIGKRPTYANAGIGYTLGSMKGRDADGRNRRVLPSNAYGLRFLSIERDWLTPVPDREQKIRRILRTVDRIFFNPRIGLMLLSQPVANTAENGRLIGRINTIPPGCSENGEYHHGQMFMHYYRLQVPGEADTAWKHFKPMISALRDERLGGPFESPACSYQTEREDPHFGQGMYFGLSGTVDWLVEFVHSLAGVELNLHDPSKPALRVTPRLPSELGGELTFRRIIHAASGKGYRQIPLTIQVRREGRGTTVRETRVIVNGRLAAEPEIRSLIGIKEVRLELVEIRD